MRLIWIFRTQSAGHGITHVRRIDLIFAIANNLIAKMRAQNRVDGDIDSAQWHCRYRHFASGHFGRSHATCCILIAIDCVASTVFSALHFIIKL